MIRLRYRLPHRPSQVVEVGDLYGKTLYRLKPGYPTRFRNERCPYPVASDVVEYLLREGVESLVVTLHETGETVQAKVEDLATHSATYNPRPDKWEDRHYLSDDYWRPFEGKFPAEEPTEATVTIGDTP